MSGVPPAPAAAPAAKPAKKRRSSKPRKTGPTVSDRILKVVGASKERGGVSLVALKKGLASSGYDVAKNNARIRLAVRRLVTNGSLVQKKGTGASGSFKIGKKPAPKKKTVKKAKKPKAKRAKGAKKAKQTKATGTPKKRRRRSKSPKKAKRPAAAKKPKSPRKAKRRVSKGKSKRAAAKKK